MQQLDSPLPHPVDQLIVRLIHDDELVASPDDVRLIVDRMATAPFNPQPVRVPARDRGMEYGGIVLGQIVSSEQLHLFKRVRRELQWAEGTTLDEYLQDLRAAVWHPDARVLVYERGPDLYSVTITPTFDVVPAHRLGSDALPNLIVVYSARHANVRSGYMFSTVRTVNFPEKVRWLG